MMCRASAGALGKESYRRRGLPARALEMKAGRAREPETSAMAWHLGRLGKRLSGELQGFRASGAGCTPQAFGGQGWHARRSRSQHIIKQKKKNCPTPAKRPHACVCPPSLLQCRACRWDARHCPSLAPLTATLPKTKDRWCRAPVSRIALPFQPKRQSNVTGQPSSRYFLIGHSPFHAT